MLVRDLMTEHPATVNVNSTIKTVNALMHKKNLRNLIVVSDDNEVVGIITYSDLFRQILPNYSELFENEEYFIDPQSIEERMANVSEKRISEVMTREPEVVSPDLSAVEAGAKMIAHRVKQLPVVENGKLVGIISHYDITWGFLMRNCKFLGTDKKTYQERSNV